MSKEDTKELPMVVEYYCSHTQPIERELNGVTAASERWLDYTREEKREIMPILKTKKDSLRLLPVEK